MTYLSIINSLQYKAYSWPTIHWGTDSTKIGWLRWSWNHFYLQDCNRNIFNHALVSKWVFQTFTLTVLSRCHYRPQAEGADAITTYPDLNIKLEPKLYFTSFSINVTAQTVNSVKANFHIRDFGSSKSVLDSRTKLGFSTTTFKVSPLFVSKIWINTLQNKYFCKKSWKETICRDLK